MDLAAAQTLLAECFPTKSGLLNLKYLEGKRAMVKLTVKDSPKLPEFVAELEALEARWAEEAPVRAARARALPPAQPAFPGRPGLPRSVHHRGVPRRGI